MLKTKNNAIHDCVVIENLTSGLVLTRAEAAGVFRGSGLNISGATIKWVNRELFLCGSRVESLKQFNAFSDFVPNRMRKLLLTKRELRFIDQHIKQKPKQPILPTSAYIKNGKLKIVLSIVEFTKKDERKKKLEAISRQEIKQGF